MHAPYVTRPIRFMGVRTVGTWRVKEYRIAARGGEPAAPLQRAARAVTDEVLLGPAVHTDHYGVAMLGIHQGATDNLVFISWWTDVNELQHRVYRSPSDAPELLAAVGEDGAIGCVWDLRVLAFEAQAWVDEVLRPGNWSHFEPYLEKGWTCDA